MSESNKTPIANRKQLKNFIVVFQEKPDLLFLLMKYSIEKIIEKFGKLMKKEDKERNIFIVSPIIHDVFRDEIRPLFNKQAKLKNL